MLAGAIDVGQELDHEIYLFSRLKLWRRHGRQGTASTRLDLPDLERRRALIRKSNLVMTDLTQRNDAHVEGGFHDAQPGLLPGLEGKQSQANQAQTDNDHKAEEHFLS